MTTGSLTVEARGWTFDETRTCCRLHASNLDSWLRTHDLTLFFDDPLRVDSLVNSWAIVLGMTRQTQLHPDRGGSSWTSDTGLRVYLDASGTQILGAADIKGGIAFSYADWIQSGGLELPRSIVRMRGGVPDGSFVIDDYSMQWSPAPAQAPQSATVTGAQPDAVWHALPASTASWQGMRLFGMMAAIAIFALLVVLWLRRDAFMERAGRWLAQDPRAWQATGDSIFVSSEGLLTFQRCAYRVGPLFFNRKVVVHTSPLFLKVSAPGEARTLILARKFSAPIPFVPRARGGFTLIESLTASALFAVVIVGAVFPALIVLAHADRIAARHETALRIAANALTDEEAALAYVPVGSAISDETKVALVDGLTVSERVAPATVAGLHTLTIDVSDATGNSLARLVTVLGPPVPPPSASGSPPPGAP